MVHPVLQFLSRHRIGVGLGASAVAALAGMIALVAFAGGGEATGRRSGPRLAVAVVPPVERAVDPGTAMDVGDLTDGFDRTALERQPETLDDADLPPEAYVGEDWRLAGIERMPMPGHLEDSGLADRTRRPVGDRDGGERAPVMDALADGSRSFGFDRPRRDFAAERASRWAAREAESPRPEDRNDGPRPYSEVVEQSSE